MIADKCEKICYDGFQIDLECDQVAVGVTEDEVLVCEDHATMEEEEGGKVTYYGEDC